MIVRRFNNDNYNFLLKLLKNLGIKKNKKAEQKIRKYALEGYKKLILEKTKDSKEFNKKIREYKKEINKSNLESGIFECEKHSFQFTFSPKEKLLVGNFKSKEFNIDEFYSLILSNTKL